MGHFYHKENNDLSQALASNTVKDYLEKVGPTRLTSEALELIEHNLRVDKEYMSREEIAIGLIYKLIDLEETPMSRVVDNAYELTDQIIEKRNQI